METHPAFMEACLVREHIRRGGRGVKIRSGTYPNLTQSDGGGYRIRHLKKQQTPHK